jgi:hypothetical protein
MQAVPTAASTTPRLARREWLALGSLLALALAARLLYLGLVTPMPVVSDASGYDAAARRLIVTGSYAYPVGQRFWSDETFREDAWEAFVRMPPNAFSMPGYAWFVAGIYRLCGAGPERFQPVRVTQAVFAVMTLALIFGIGDALLGRRAGWVALALNAFYPSGIRAVQYLLTETVFTLLLVVQVALMVWASRSRRRLAYASLGVATAAAMYVRPVAGLVPLLLLALELYRRGAGSYSPMPFGRLAVRFGLLGLVVALVMAPWVARNGRLYGVFMPTTSAPMLPAIQGETIVRGLPFPAETIPQLADLAPYGNDDHRFAVESAARIAARMPRATMAEVLAAQRVKARMLGVALTSPFTFFSTAAPVMSVSFAMQASLLALALIGLGRRRREPEMLALVGGVPIYFAAVHWMVSILWSRYLYPAMPMVLMMAAAGLVPPEEPARADRRPRPGRA